MKTNKPMQILILKKSIDNIEKGLPYNQGIQFLSPAINKWCNSIEPDENSNSLSFAFNCISYRIKPETITINGVEIPKPLTKEEFKVRSNNDEMVYYPKPHSHLYGSMFAEIHDFKEGDIFYGIPSIAIEASKLLFGIK